MASKTPQVQLGKDWTRIDGGGVAIGGKVIRGDCYIEYCDANDPLASDIGIPFEEGEPFQLNIATGDRVYARAAGTSAFIAFWRRGA